MSTASPAAVTLNPQILGQAENAHRALLEKVLAGTGLDYPAWVALKLASVGPTGTGDQLAARVAAATKLDTAKVTAALDAVIAAGLLESRDGELTPTASGDDLHRDLSATIATTLGRVYGQVSAEDLAVAGRVLATVTAGVNAELAAS
ncbi:MarR family transcriptional regulator [Catenulispora subtropica]|uniref:Transcriptional regulator, MarR family n=1 Tax=Catenulispora subtropica TaxID=450798 RepID=A0ABP5CIY4_9ACTN